MGKLEWSWRDKGSPNILDIMGDCHGREICDAESPKYTHGRFPVHVYCTRLANHTGRHAASTGARIIAVWL